MESSGWNRVMEAFRKRYVEEHFEGEKCLSQS